MVDASQELDSDDAKVVATVLNSGYMMHGERVLREAQVTTMAP